LPKVFTRLIISSSDGALSRLYERFLKLGQLPSAGPLASGRGCVHCN